MANTENRKRPSARNVRRTSAASGQPVSGGRRGGTGNKKETEAERQQRLRRSRARREQMRRKRRQKLIRRCMIVLIVIAAVILAAAGISAVVAKIRADKEAALAAERAKVNTVSASDVLHLSFRPLQMEESVIDGSTADTDAADDTDASDDGSAADAANGSTANADENTADGTDGEDQTNDGDEQAEEDAAVIASLYNSATASCELTASDFEKILEQLYADNYVLVDITSLVTKDESGQLKEGTIDIPAGKKPLIISEQSMTYDPESGNYPSGMILDDEGNIQNTYLCEDGTTKEGAYDVVPVLDEFVREHPDFSHDGAKGILAITGSNGILGYDADNTNALSPLLEKLRSDGWRIASGGYAGISYGSEFEMVKEDADLWEKEVEPAVGSTDILILPQKADIGPWSGYTEDNEKYVFLNGKGFRYYCVENDDNFSWVQMSPAYVRLGTHLILREEDFEQTMGLESGGSVYRTDGSDSTDTDSAEDNTAGTEEKVTDSNTDKTADSATEDENTADGAQSAENKTAADAA